MAKYLVIDISKYQGNIDFAKVKASGVFGVIIRVAYRGYGSAGTIVIDPYFQQYVDCCVKAGLPYGVYFFSQAKTIAEAQEEANITLMQLKKQAVQPLFPVYIDTEYGNTLHTGRADKLSKTVRTAAVKAFCEVIEKAGYFAGIYASTSWFNNQLNDNELLGYSHWVAHYSSKCGYTKAHHMWQYSSSGKINGIAGRCDVNECYLDFPTTIKNAGLNGYQSPTRKLYKVATGEMSEGDKNTICNQLDELKIGYTVTETK